ncbi:inter-alpha-trypsin inhibitor heavy chain H3-like [Patiria miniata]|uniref:Inter-alpha-trypsin inhibitor heavy chain H4 n=1 Tax=Patiria miniata TaxID=46514 RepID=A0A913ZS11_PATMI|nr:inter-alpha-trypsin inhibitor heavy chain H3-like [Patiria miniata]
MHRLKDVLSLIWFVLCMACISIDFSEADPWYQTDIDTPAFLAVDDLMVFEREERAAIGGSGSGMASSGDGFPWEREDEVNVVETPDPVRIRSLRVTSSVTARYAKTVVTSHMVNPTNQSLEATFKMELPGEAFISGFLIETEGKVYYSIVDEKEKAQRTYDAAKEQGQTAGQVKQTSEKKNLFAISINVAAESELSFNMTYEELLKRKDGHFQNAVAISPGQIIDHLLVVVHITEPQGLEENKLDYFVERPQLSDRSRNEEVLRPLWAETKHLHGSKATVQFHPKREEQEALSASGNLGKFVVQYDVIHEQNAGNIEIVNGYFVHHFSPAGFRPTQKNVVFVLDTSGSMSGTKMRQTKEAMDTILTDLREKDAFGIVTFETVTQSWRPSLLPASRENVAAAKEYTGGLSAGGGTNLHQGLVDAIGMLEEAEANELSTFGTFYLIIMLTDGAPTAGELTRPDEIKSDIRRRLESRYSLFCLGFGRGADYPFLEQLSLQNKGLARKIYEDSDAGLQLVGFFDEVATPLLVNVHIKYSPDMMVTNSISTTLFPTYFEGTELVVAGQLDTNKTLPDSMFCVVTAETQDTEIKLEMTVNVKEESDVIFDPQAVDDFAQRLWAFLTIKELLRKRIAAELRAEKQDLTQRALELSLKYHFVTPLTSLVVVKPDDDPVVDAVEPSEDDIAPEGGSAPGASSRGGGSPASAGPVSPAGSGGPTAFDLPTGNQPGTYVDADPHFMVHSPRGNVTVCFNIMGKPGDVFSLIKDPVFGISVDGHVENFHRHDDQSASTSEPPPTIFDRLVVTTGGGRQVLITATSVSLGPELSMTWDTDWEAELGAGASVAVRNGQYLVFRPKTGVELLIMRHDVARHRVDKVDFFGVYVIDGEGFSHKVHGILGQFQRRKIHLERKLATVDGIQVKGHIWVRGRRIEVIQSEKRDRLTQTVEPCWYADNNAEGVIDGTYTDYLVGG